MYRQFAIPLCAVVVWFATWPSSVVGYEPVDLIERIVSRSSAMVSGRLTYTFKMQPYRGDRAMAPVAYPIVTTSYSDSSWAERTHGSHVVRVNHDGYFLEFVQTPQKDGSVRPGATLLPQRSLESRAELNSPPIFAGTFWFREQLRYVEKHGEDFQSTGSSTLGTIPVELVELRVPAQDHGTAFHVLVPALKNGGTIRLYVAPQLGFVLPRIEFLTTSRQVAQSYEATGFTEAAPGIYVPDRIWTETHSTRSAPRYRAEFTTRFELVNESIPEDDFTVKLPIGTRVQDAREPGNVVTFELTDPSLSSILPSLGSNAESWPPVGFLGRWQNAIILGFLIGAVASISALVAARNQRHRG